jgi:hypothetical protein
VTWHSAVSPYLLDNKGNKMPTVDELKKQLVPSSNFVVNRRYNIVYIQENPNMGFSLVSDIPFQIPVVGQWFEGSHNDVKLSGKVTKLDFHSNTYMNGANWGSLELIFVYLDPTA